MTPIDRLGTVDSTNLEAARRAAAGETGTVWLQADTQTAGRGRLGRDWESLPGNLHATRLKRTIEDDPAWAALHSFTTALAIAAYTATKPPAAKIEQPTPEPQASKDEAKESP